MVHRNLAFGAFYHEKIPCKAIASIKRAISIDQSVPLWFSELSKYYEVSNVDFRENLELLENNLSVRETEDLIKANKKPNTSHKHEEAGLKKLKDPNILDYEKYLSLKLGYKVEIKDKSGKGYLLVKYKTLDQLDTIVNLFNK